MKQLPWRWFGLGILTLSLAVLVTWERTQSHSSPPNQAAIPVAASGDSRSTEPAPPASDTTSAPSSSAPPPDIALPKPAKVPARLIFGSAWGNETQPELRDFSHWVNQYLATSGPQRPALLEQGKALADRRLVALKSLIASDPEGALAATVPATVRAQLPESLGNDKLEQRLSGTGNLELIAGIPAPDGPPVQTYRSAVLDNQEYRAYVYGRRTEQATKQGISLMGIAVDGVAAISESPVRVLEPGEVPVPGKPTLSVDLSTGEKKPETLTAAANTKDLTVVESGRAYYHLSRSADVPTFEQQLIAKEDAAGPYPVGEQLTAADGQPGTSGVSGRPPVSWSTGAKKVLIIRVDFSDKTGTPLNTYVDGQPITATTGTTVFASGSNAVQDFYYQGSYGLTSLSLSGTDVSAVYRMPQTAAYYATNGFNSTLHADAEALATAGGYTLANYDKLLVVFSSLSSISGSQITYGGLADIQGTRVWINGELDFRVAAHEIGHTYGLQHANLWQVADGNPISSSGTSTEYADPFDTMGGGSTDYRCHFNSFDKSVLHWIPDSSVTTITTGSTYRVYRFDHGSANTANPLALKVVRNSTQDYWISLRKQFTTNTSLSNGAYVIWANNSVVQTTLLDFTTPGTDPQDAALAAGTSFHDTVAGITLNPLAVGGASPNEYLDVQISFDPRIQWSGTSLNVDELSGIATLTVTRTFNSIGTVSVNYTTADGTAVAGTHYTTQSGTLTWANGDGSTKTIQIPITTTASFTGVKSFTVNLSGISGGVLSSGSSITINIASAGASDSSYKANFVNNTVNKAVVQPDGKVILGGWFTQMQDASFAVYTRNGFGRLNADGSVDTTWGNGSGINAFPIYSMALQPDGKLLIVGAFTSVHGVTRNYVARLNTDGSLDTSFDPGSGASGTVRAVALQPDGKILVGGDFTTFNSVAREYVARLNPDGSLDSTYVGPDFAGSGGWSVCSLALQPDNKVLIGGVFYFSGFSNFKAGICRTGTNGTLDSSFDPGAGATLDGNTSSLRRVYAIAVQRDGKIVLGGEFTGFNGATHNYLVRVTSSGAVDSSFTGSADNTVDALAIQGDNKILVTGAFANLNSTASSHFGRLNAGGTIDSSFGVGSGASVEVRDVELQADGRMVIAGAFGTYQGIGSVTSARFFAGQLGIPGAVQFFSSSATGVEGNNLTLTATRTGGSYGAVSVNYAIKPGTAATSRYVAVSGSLAWADGDAASKTITLSLLNDNLTEADQTFTVNLGVPIGGIIPGSPTAATVTVSTAYNQWKQTNFTASDLSNSAISGDNADPDNDGIPNLMEYALGLNPKTNSVTNVPAIGSTTISGTSYLTLTFRRQQNAPDLTYLPQSGPDPSTWTGSPVIISGPTSNGDGTETVTYRDDQPISSNAKRFMRLKVTSSP